MSTYDLILKRRTIRKFEQKQIPKKILLNCVNAARLAPSAANIQPLEYIIITKNLDKIFPHTRWAGYLKNGAPKKDERPVAYIIILSNENINPKAKYDAGIATENIILTALEKRISSCLIGSLNREELIKILDIPKNYTIELVIALGYPKQESVEEKFTGDIKYWLDKKGILHVPKKNLNKIIHEEKF